MAPNPLLSTAKSSDSGIRAALHPLVLLTISDYITRHTLTHQAQPIVGALLGQQNGREITIEVAYDVRLAPPSGKDQSPGWQLDDGFFAARLAQYKEVYKAPALDLVGWWTVSPATGPGAEVLGVHRHVLHSYNEAALLLAFCPETVKRAADAQQQQLGGKLPLTIYETVYESGRRGDADADAMQVEGESEPLEMRFKELGYDIATGEAEMIGVDTVARSSGNATAGEGGGSKTAAPAPASAPPLEEESPPESKRKRGRPPKNKGKARDEGEDPVDAMDSQDLNAEEEREFHPISSLPRKGRYLT